MRGLRITGRGYVQVRIMHRGVFHHKNFGKDSPIARELAQIYLAEKRKEILMGRFGVVAEVPRMRFSEAAHLFFQRWSTEKDAEGKLAHRTPDETKRVIDVRLIPWFGKRWFDDIRPADVVAWRQARLKTVLGTSVNREQAVLSSIFSHIERWVKNEEIKQFKLPRDPESGVAMNPCESVEKAPNRKRDRVVQPYEISKLKYAARELGDENARDIISLAVKTCLSLKDLKKLKCGDTVNLRRSKTDVQVIVPITVLFIPDWRNWRKRWSAIREKAGLLDVEARDLRKAGINFLLALGHDLQWVSQYAGHAEKRTTETIYSKVNIEKMQALAQDIDKAVEAL